jgi:hypothetical protein
MDNNHCSSCSAWGTIFSAWLVACVATLGSLFFSEVMRVPAVCSVLVSTHLYVPTSSYLDCWVISRFKKRCEVFIAARHYWLGNSSLP